MVRIASISQLFKVKRKLARIYCFVMLRWHSYLSYNWLLVGVVCPLSLIRVFYWVWRYVHFTVLIIIIKLGYFSSKLRRRSLLKVLRLCCVESCNLVGWWIFGLSALFTSHNKYSKGGLRRWLLHVEVVLLLRVDKLELSELVLVCCEKLW